MIMIWFHIFPSVPHPGVFSLSGSGDGYYLDFAIPGYTFGSKTFNSGTLQISGLFTTRVHMKTNLLDLYALTLNKTHHVHTDDIYRDRIQTFAIFFRGPLFLLSPVDMP